MIGAASAALTSRDARYNVRLHQQGCGRPSAWAVTIRRSSFSPKNAATSANFTAGSYNCTCRCVLRSLTGAHAMACVATSWASATMYAEIPEALRALHDGGVEARTENLVQLTHN